MGKETILDVKIKYSGLLDSGAVYQGIVDFLDSNGFDLVEKSFKYKDKGNKIDLETEIEFSKDYEEDIKVEGKLELKMEGVEDVVVKRNNTTKNLQRADNVEVKISANYIDNYGSNAKSTLDKVLIEIYKKTLAKKHFENIKKKAEDDMSSLVKEIKKLLNLHSYLS